LSRAANARGCPVDAAVRERSSRIETDLVTTLAITLAAAGIGGVLAVLLRQSVVLGFVVAGALVGPNTPGLVADGLAVEQLADIGIVMVMFAIGVQLSFSELRRVGGIAIGGGLIQVLLLIGAGYGVGLALGWGTTESLLFGAVISNSSSTVMGKLLSERGEAASLHGRIGLAWSTVQDLSTIVLVVLFTAASSDSNGPLVEEIARALLLAGAYFVIFVPVGIILIPRIVERLTRIGSREVLVLATMALALGTAYAASLFGISYALGAFVAGIVVARSDISHEVLSEIAPLRDVFAGIFFVSVGMLFDPGLALENWDLVLITVALIVGLKGVVAAVITKVAGYPARTAVLTGIVLSQSAEFSFLLARLGSDLGELSEEVFGSIIAGSVISIVLLPSLYYVGHPLARWVQGWMPGQAAAPLNDAVEVPVSAGHAIVCGYGRVGRVIVAALKARNIPMVVLEQDIHTIATLRGEGIAALYGSASNSTLLEQAGIDRARVLVVAVPDPVSARRIVDFATERNPSLDIVVRTHSKTERDELQRRGASEAVLGELELALEMSRHSMQRFGTDDAEAEALVEKLRAESM
jgi:monovalent cation:H+ antiporter-2, CPA2 family